MDSTGDSLPQRLIVSNIPDGTSIGFLRLFLQNEGKSGGGRIQELDYQVGDSVALVTYKEPTVTERVLQKGKFTLQKTELTVKPLIWNKKTVEIQGFAGEPSVDDLEYLELLYESKKDTGGGKIETLEPTECGVIITFENDKDAKEVLERKTVTTEEWGDLKASIPSPRGW